MIAGVPVINKGVNGEQTFEMLARFGQDVIALSPRSVVIWGYINDVFRSEKANIKDKLHATRDNLKKMVFTAREHRILPILATEITICGPSGFREAAAAFAGRLIGKESYQDYVNEHVRALNLWIRQLSNEHEINLLDFESELSDDDGARKTEYAEADGSHISPRGYDQLTNYIRKQIK